MKGLFPWLHEFFFGPQCKSDFCSSLPSAACGCGLCAQHHWLYCQDGFTGRYLCAPRPTSRSALRVIHGGKRA